MGTCFGILDQRCVKCGDSLARIRRDGDPSRPSCRGPATPREYARVESGQEATTLHYFRGSGGGNTHHRFE